ncbi:uncharacterized protein LOC132724600 isoform X2 [Ruditapes philippinarum]|uniref:uncharacterized protein LOC132724600 isoform X2 n=1 Tax=Ruditapes philippinarum TaxID=129788 RepID=UPI00295B176D|nr:uncharacterized protein LOC132724600 isoform X2 [Ruditapes philippinarum]
MDTLDLQEKPHEQTRKHQIGNEADYTQEKGRYQGALRPIKRRSVVKRAFSLSKDVKNLEIYENGNLVIRVYEADILKVPTEGIVNAANEDLLHIGGIAGAIAKHAGKKLEEESRNIVKEEGKLKVSSVVCTSGGNLDFTHVLHAVGPRWRDYQPFTEANVQKCADDLKLTYLQCLRMAESKQIKTLAIPTISSGIFKVPKDVCAVQYAEAILEFGDRTDVLKELHVVDKDSDMIDIVQKIFYAMLIERKAAPNCLSKFVDTQVEQTKMGIHDKETNTMKNMKNTGRDKPKTTEDCVICMDKVTDEKRLNCGHIFCSECIDGYFRVKMVCPTCGKVCGIVTGDQPSGKMRIDKIRQSVTGFEVCKGIAITYQFGDGKQGPAHPKPGDFYKGISRTAFLPDNKEGREICAMLKVAFERRLVFTIGTSRTTGQEGVITWNDIHHKTDLRPYTQFGYPDATYLQRVKEELAVKGVTIDDVNDDFIEQIKNSYFRQTICV